MKLSPIQIGVLATHIKTALWEWPLPIVNAGASVEYSPAQTQQEPWEAYLSKVVDADDRLPAYEQIVKDHEVLLEFLVEYYTIQ